MDNETKDCACGATSIFVDLPLVGWQIVGDLIVEERECSCGSTVGVILKDTGELAVAVLAQIANELGDDSGAQAAALVEACELHVTSMRVAPATLPSERWRLVTALMRAIADGVSTEDAEHALHLAGIIDALVGSGISSGCIHANQLQLGGE